LYSLLTVNPSCKEGWGLTVVESNACGTPVIASNSPGLKDSIINGTTGLLYDYGNINKMAEYIIKVLKDDELREKLSINAIDWSNKFNWDNSSEEMLKLIEKVIKNYKR